MVKPENLIVSTLESSDGGLTLAEIANRVGCMHAETLIQDSIGLFSSSTKSITYLVEE